MSVRTSTEQRLIDAIVAHQLGRLTGRLQRQDLADSVGISRQALNRYYKHLDPYIKGERSASELLDDSGDIRSVLATSQSTIAWLQEQLAKAEAEKRAAIKSVRESHVTTLMCGDIMLTDNREIRERIEKQALHIDVLLKEKLRLQSELTAARVRELDASKHVATGRLSGGNIIGVEPDLNEALRSYARTGDREGFEVAKDRAMDNLIGKVLPLCKAGSVRVILFVERYLLSFAKYLDHLKAQALAEVVVIRAPLLSRPELKHFAAKLVPRTSLELHFPICTNEAVARAQRQFLYREVPQPEKDAADNMPLPVVQDGYDQVLTFVVRQGD